MKRFARFYFLSLFIVSLLAALLTTAGLFQNSPFEGWFNWLVFVDFVLIFLALVSVFFVGFRLWVSWRRGEAGARLSLRLAALFVGMSLVPVTILYGVSTAGVIRGVESWFDTPLQGSFEKGIDFGRDVVGQEFTRLEKVAVDIADGLSLQRGGLNFWLERGGLNFWLDDVRRLSQLSFIALYNREGELLFYSGGPPVLGEANGWTPPAGMLAQVAEAGGYYKVVGGGEDREIDFALAMPDSPNVFAVRVSRPLPADIAKGLNEVERGEREYLNLLALRKGLKLSFIMVLTLSFTLMMLFAVWLSLNLGRRLTLPLARLALAAAEVGKGKFPGRLKENIRIGELGQLNRSFNGMVEDLRQSRQQIQQRQDDLRAANAYMQNLLSSLAAGVLAFDSAGKLSGHNAAAEKLAETPLAELAGKTAGELAGVPFFAAVEEALASRPQSADADAFYETQARVGGRALVFRVSRLAGEAGGGVLVVADDITAQVRAEREATWEEAGRRFVHEIKNPLTPVQLAAERLQHKLAPKLTAEDAGLLSRLTETIVNQVGAMRQMVDTFRGYAAEQRMRFEAVDFRALLQDVLTLYETRNVRWHLQLAEGLPPVWGDKTQLRQLLHNALVNACDAANANANGKGGAGEPPAVWAQVGQKDGMLEFVVEDNGGGIDDSLLPDVCEPYVTTKPGGTGLGLAVARRVADLHGGALRLQNGERGLRFVAILPFANAASKKDGQKTARRL